MTQGPFRMLRRTVLAACMFAGFLALSAPASAATLCAGGEDFIDDADGICRNFFPGDTAKFYLFDAVAGFEHLLRITVADVLFGPEDEDGGGFGLRFRANQLPAGSTFPGFPDLTCVAYGPGGTCIEYEAIAEDGTPLEDTDNHPINGVDYVGPVTWLISWTQPVGISPIPEIIHEIGEESPQDKIYDEILEGIFFSAELGPFDFDCDFADYPEVTPCGFDEGGIEFFSVGGKIGDPTRAGLSNNFTSAAVVQTTPEPGTLALLGIGLTGYVVNRRRRDQR